MNLRARRSSNALLAMGALAIAVGLGEYLFTGFQASHRQSELRRAFTADTPTLRDVRSDLGRAGVKPDALGSPVARLRIARAGIDAIVVEGVGSDELARGPGRYPSSALVGADGTTAIAGHRTGWGSPFLHLDRLTRGDVIVLDSRGVSYRYRVTRTLVTRPESAWVLAGDPRSDSARKLTLTTCTPPFTSRDRLIVWADLVDELNAVR